MSTVTVDREALRAILTAVTGFMEGDTKAYCELEATATDPNGPLMKVIRDFNSSEAYQTITDGLFGGESE